MLKARNYWGRECRKFRSESLAKKYREFEFLANESIKEFKQEQWKNFIKRQGKHPLSTIPFWKRINRLRESKRKKKIASLVHNGTYITENSLKAELFAEKLEKKFKLDENDAFNNTHRTNVDSFIMTGQLEQHFT